MKISDTASHTRVRGVGRARRPCLARRALPPFVLVALAIAFALPAVASAAVQFGIAGTTSKTTGTTMTMTSPTSSASNNLLVAVVACNGDSTVSAPSGWTKLHGTAYSTNFSQSVFYKAAGDSVSATSYAFTITYGSEDNKAVGWILCYNGVDQSSPVSASSTNPGSSTTMTALSVPVLADGLAIAILGTDNDTLNCPTTPTGMTFESRSRYASIGPDNAVVIAADQAYASTQVTGDKTSTASDSPTAWVAQLVALRPAPTSITVTATADDKTYDGNTAATVHLSSTGVASGDDVTFSYTSATFDTKDVGIDKEVTVEGISIGGADAGNYTLANTTAAATANITAAELTVTADDQTKPFGATFTFAGTEFTTTGLATGDAVTAVTLQSDGAAAAAAAGTYPIVASAAVGTGLDNYEITYVDGTLTVTNVYMITAFAKPLRARDARKFHRGALIKVAFRVRVNGELVTDMRVRMKVTNAKGFTFGPRTVKYNVTKGRYYTTFRTTSAWKLGYYTVKAYIPGGLAQRTVRIRIIR